MDLYGVPLRRGEGDAVKRLEEVEATAAILAEPARSTLRCAAEGFARGRFGRFFQLVL